MGTHQELILKEKLKTLQDLCGALDPYHGPLDTKIVKLLGSLGIQESNPFKVTNDLLMMMDQTQSQLKKFSEGKPCENE
jgi:hypothetical protein